MAKNREEGSKGIVKIGGTDVDFLAKYMGPDSQDTSLSGMEGYVVVPRAKVIQGQTDQALQNAFGLGSVIIRPGDKMITKVGGSFPFVPLFFCVEFCKWADYKDKENAGNPILERSFDPTSEIAKRSQDRNRRFETYPEDVNKQPDKQRRYRWVEHLIFVGVIYDPEHELFGQEVTVSFAKGEFGTGKNFISAIRLRKALQQDGSRKTIPLWSQVWHFSPALRDRGTDGKWYGLDFAAGEPGVILASSAEEFYNRHLELARAHEENRLRVEAGDDNEESEGSSGAAASANSEM